MNQNMHNPNALPHSDHEPDETLRRVATLPPPVGLEDRVHHRLRSEQSTLPARSIWSLWMPARRLQFAGAAMLVLALAGSTWRLYHTKNGAVVIQPAPQTSSPATPGNSFGSAGAERHPSTLTPIKVPPAPKKKPAASHPGAKPSPKKLANPAQAATESAQ
jgi:hypothetical protein